MLYRSQEKRSSGSGIRAVWPLVASLVLLMAPASLWAQSDPAETTTVQSGHSALWFDPARNGEGWQLEILGNDQAALYWYTYDDEGNQRWLFGTGNVVTGETGEFIDFPELLVSSGGQFGPDFDPEDVTFEVAGSAVMSFTDCDTGQFAYSAFDQSQVIDIQRLTHTMASGCESINGTPGQPVKEYAGQSGSWFDLAHDGEGFALQWLSRDVAVVTWYTYDAEGNQFWMTGVGEFEDGQIVFPELSSTQGGQFGAAFDPDDVEFFEWGSLTMNLSCTSGSASYASDLAEFGEGTFDLTRLTQLARPSCPYIKPKFTDLYQINWNEIPIDPPTATESNVYRAWDVANDGTIAAEHGNQLALWRPETQQWELVDRNIGSSGQFINAEGNQVIASDPVGEQESPPIRWIEGFGWNPLPDLLFGDNVVESVSPNFEFVVGRGQFIGEALEHPWIWSEELGQQALPLTDDITGWTPRSAGNDGTRVIGHTLKFIGNFPFRVAVAYENGGEPVRLTDDSGSLLGTAEECVGDCRSFFGSGHGETDATIANLGQAWFHDVHGEIHFLGAITDAIVDPLTYLVNDASSDGTVVVGEYTTFQDIENPVPQELTARAFIWTQTTGILSVRILVEALGIGDDDWENQEAIAISADGSKVLLQGRRPNSSHRRAIVLELSPY